MKITDTRAPSAHSRTLSRDGDLGTPAFGTNPFDHPVTPGAVVTVEGLTGLYLLCQENAASPAHGINGHVRHFLVNLGDGTRWPAAARVLTHVEAHLTIK